MRRIAAVCLLFLPMACAPARPATVPPSDDLAAFLRDSPSVRAIGEAAARENLLSDAPPETEQLRIVLTAFAIDDLGELERRLQAVAPDVPLLLAALRRYTRASRSGDLAHWTTVALLALDPRDPGELAELHGLAAWDDRYRADVLALRHLHEQGGLRQLITGEARGTEGGHAELVQPVLLKPSLADSQLPTFRAHRSAGYWPVFAEPGGRAVVGVETLAKGFEPTWDDYRLLLRRPGSLRVREAMEVRAPESRLPDEGSQSSGTGQLLQLQAGKLLELAAWLPGADFLVRLPDDRIVQLPMDCCSVREDPDAVWWLHLAAGDSAGGWIEAPRSLFEIRYPAWEELMSEAREERRRRRLGRLGTGGTWEMEGGARLIYWVEGDAAAGVESGMPPLFVLHGGPGLGSAYLREPLTDELGPDRVVVFFDQRGSGYSEGRDDTSRLTMDWLVSDLDALRRAAEVERIDLLGHSFGGLLALRYALRHPDRVRRLVLVDPDPPSRDDWETFRDRIAARLDPEDATAIAAIEQQPDWQSSPEAMTRWFRLRMHAYVADPSATDVSITFDDATLANLRTTGPAIRADLGDWDLTPRLGEIRAPLLVVTGSQTIFDPGAMERLAAALPDARLEVLDGVGHFPFLEAPDAFASLVRAFLSDRADPHRGTSESRRR